MIWAMCGVKLLDQRNSEELMDMLGIKESLDRMAKASSMRCYGHVLRKADENVNWRLWNLKWAVVEEEEDRNKRGKSQ